jgi:hypothetical protein
MPHTSMHGLAWFREHLLTFHECYPDLVITVEGQVAEDDIVVTWWTMRGTHSGEWGGVRPTHKPMRLSGVNVQKILNGRIVEHFGGSTSLECLMELGIVNWSGGLPDSRKSTGPVPMGTGDYFGQGRPVQWGFRLGRQLRLLFGSRERLAPGGLWPRPPSAVRC